MIQKSRKPFKLATFLAFVKLESYLSRISDYSRKHC